MNEVERIIEQLRAKGWSTTAIARGVGVHYDTVRRWRSGGQRPDNENAVMIVLRQMLDRPLPKRPYNRTNRQPKF
jgi:DNA-binding transcriptional regulator YiaG